MLRCSLWNWVENEEYKFDSISSHPCRGTAVQRPGGRKQGVHENCRCFVWGLELRGLGVFRELGQGPRTCCGGSGVRGEGFR